MSIQKNLITLCFATVFTLGLAACGGGGSSDEAEAADDGRSRSADDGAGSGSASSADGHYDRGDGRAYGGDRRTGSR